MPTSSHYPHFKDEDTEAQTVQQFAKWHTARQWVGSTLFCLKPKPVLLTGDMETTRKPLAKIFAHS